MIQKLIREAKKSPHSKSKHCAMVIKGGAILSIAVNRNNVHAEVNALKKIWPNKRKGTKILTIRISKFGFPTYARPCNKCMEFLKENGVSEIQYSNYSDAYGFVISRERI